MGPVSARRLGWVFLRAVAAWPWLLLAAATLCWSPAAGGMGDAARKDPCDDPDAAVECCFAHMPLQLTHVMVIADSSEPGERLILRGTIYRADGKTPYPGVILYAYHTDHRGYYSKRGNERGIHKWHGHLHGWCRTDDRGAYEIRTIRPARYPSGRAPAHIHAAIQEPGGKEPYYITDFVFADDDLVDRDYLERLSGVGGSGVVSLRSEAHGGLHGSRDLVLGR